MLDGPGRLAVSQTLADCVGRSRRTRRSWTHAERIRALRLRALLRLSYQAIGALLGRNSSSVGLLCRDAVQRGLIPSVRVRPDRD